MRSNPILIRCDGNPSLGYGHIVRCLAIASYVSQKVIFVCQCDERAESMIAAEGYEVFIIEFNDRTAQLTNAIQMIEPTAIQIGRAHV